MALGQVDTPYPRIMRFSIRDLLWATALVAMGLGWWNEHRSMDAKHDAAVEQANRLRVTLSDAKIGTTKWGRKYGLLK